MKLLFIKAIEKKETGKCKDKEAAGMGNERGRKRKERRRVLIKM